MTVGLFLDMSTNRLPKILNRAADLYKQKEKRETKVNGF